MVSSGRTGEGEEAHRNHQSFHNTLSQEAEERFPCAEMRSCLIAGR
jgi:hypothetical protein